MIIGGLEWETIPPYYHLPRKEAYIWSSPVEVEEFFQEDALGAYPCPAIGYITIESNKLVVGDRISI